MIVLLSVMIVLHYAVPQLLAMYSKYALSLPAIEKYIMEIRQEGRNWMHKMSVDVYEYADEIKELDTFPTSITLAPILPSWGISSSSA